MSIASPEPGTDTDRAGADLNFERSHLGYAQYGVLALTRAPATP